MRSSKKPPKNKAQGKASPAPSSVFFFDLDHTLINSNCSALFGAYLCSNGLMGLPKTALLLLLYSLHKWKLLSLAKLHHWSFKLLFKGKVKESFASLVKEQVEKDFAQARSPRMNEILETSRSSGNVYIVSASPDFIVEQYAKLFRVDGFFATEYCADATGTFSHVGTVVDGKAKWGFAKDKVEGRISFAYSDDYQADKPLLDGVTHGCLVES